MPSTVLPPELIELVVDEVSQDNDETRRRAALQACSSTSWSFLIPARKHIFHTVHLIEDGGNDTEKNLKQIRRLQDFIQLLSDDPCNAYSNQPHLSSQIRNLSIQLSEERTITNYKTPGANAGHSSIVPRIFDLVPRVIGLSLWLGRSSWTSGASWIYVDAEVKEAFEVFCTSQPLVYLALQGIRCFPMAIVAQCHHLRSLSVDSMNAPGPPTPIILPPSLEKLHMSNSPDIERYLISYGTGPNKHPNMSSLRTLDIGIFSCANDWTLIQSLPSPSHLCFTNYTRPSHISITSITDFGLLSNLKILEIRCDPTNQGKDAGVLPMIRWKLFNPTESRMTPTSIESLIIHMGRRYCTRKNEERHFWPRSGWKIMDSVLFSARFPNLCDVHLKLTFSYDNDSNVTEDLVLALGKDLTQAVKKKIKKLFPSLSRSSLTYIDIDITAKPSRDFTMQILE